MPEWSPLCLLTAEPLDARLLEERVAWPGAGAILTFAGVGRDEFGGRRVRGLQYEAYAEMAVPAMREVAEEVERRWPGVRVAMAHRTGSVGIGEASVIIAVSAPHREEAYQASRAAIDALKARVPIWKKELYADGSAWLDGPGTTIPRP
jgi:molybdopterin synthase catalytic subunit